MAVITNEQTVAVVEGMLKMNTDAIGAELYNFCKQHGVDFNTALGLARDIGTIALNSGKNNDAVAANIWDAFKVTMYAELNKKGITYKDGRHNQLEAAWGEMTRILTMANRQAQQPSSVGGLLGGASGGLGGISVSPAVTAPVQGISIGAPSSAAPVSSFSPTAVDEPKPVAPIAQPAVAVGVAPQLAEAPVVKTVKQAEPYISVLKSVIMENYDAHELRAVAAMTPVEANQAVKKSQYYQAHDWSSPVCELFYAGKEVVHYKGTGIIVRAHDDSAAFMMPDSDTAKAIVAKHQAVIERIRNHTADGDDVEPLLNGVIGDIETLLAIADRTRDAAEKIIKESPADNDHVTEIEMIRFAATYRSVLDRTVYNAIAQATNRGTFVPTVDGVRFKVKAEEVKFFRDVLLKRTLGDNGLSSEADYFIEVMRVIANSVYKMVVQGLEKQEDVIEIIDSRIVINLPAKYPDIKMSNVIDSRTLGNMADPIISIYETIQREAPHSTAVLVMPSGTYNLISNGDVTATVYR